MESRTAPLTATTTERTQAVGTIAGWHQPEDRGLRPARTEECRLTALRHQGILPVVDRSALDFVFELPVLIDSATLRHHPASQ